MLMLFLQSCCIFSGCWLCILRQKVANGRDVMRDSCGAPLAAAVIHHSLRLNLEQFSTPASPLQYLHAWICSTQGTPRIVKRHIHSCPALAVAASFAELLTPLMLGKILFNLGKHDFSQFS